jgi:hypothetical protein
MSIGSVAIQSSLKASAMEREIPQEGDTVVELNQYQDDFIYTEAPYPAIVTAWGTGKTMAAIIKAMDLSQQYPGNLGIVFRKEFTDLRDSTCRDFEDYTGLTINSARNVELPNGSVIMFRHLEEMNNIQNVNLGWFWIEQAEELEEDDQYFKLFGRLRRKGMPIAGFITANTNGHNWIWKLWKQGGLGEKIRELMASHPELFAHLKNKDLTDLSPLFEAQTKDNAHNLPPAYLAGLEILKATKPRVYNRFVMNSWDEEDAIDIIINAELVRECVGRELPETSADIRKIISIDVARYGDDKAVMKAIENYAEKESQEHEKKSTMELVGLAVIMARRYGITAAEKDEDDNVLLPGQGGFAVDEIGVGGGVADRLYELGYNVVFVNAAERQDVRVGCFNRRAEIYLNGAELAEAKRFSVLPSDKNLIDQLAWARYKTIKSNGIYQVEAKDDIKKRKGRSPDDADAFLNGLWALPQVKPMRRAADRYERKFLRLRRSRMQGGSSMTV